MLLHLPIKQEEQGLKQGLQSGTKQLPRIQKARKKVQEM